MLIKYVRYYGKNVYQTFNCLEILEPGSSH